MQSIADKIIDTLGKYGVKIVFGIPSIHNMALYEALRKDTSIQHILCRHETTAVHMADGYARTRQRLGVIIASTGPGTGYTIPAIQEAFGACSPILMITTNIARSKIGMGLGSLHELKDQDQMFRTITKSTVCMNPGEDIRLLVQRAIYTAMSDRRGPVYLEIPEDSLYEAYTAQEKKRLEIQEYIRPNENLEKALAYIHGAKQPFIIAGVSTRDPDIARDVKVLAEKIGAPVVSTVLAKGIIAEDHPLSFGNAARRGQLRELIKSCDLAIAIGTRLREVDAKRRGLKLPPLIHLDWDETWVNKNFPADVALLGDISSNLSAIIEGIEATLPITERTEWMRERRENIECEMQSIFSLHPEMLYLSVIRKVLARDSILVTDNTLLGYWAEYFYPAYFPGSLICGKGSTTIGFSFAAAMGAKLAFPKKQVVALIGDGGFLYSDQELATCIRHGIHFPLIVINDNSFGVVSYLQRKKFGKDYETRLTNPDFVAMAGAYGIHGYRADSPDSFEAALKESLQTSSMCLIEVTEHFQGPPFAKY